MKCSKCKKEISGLPHACNYCSKYHCSEHLLPESHGCKGLKEKTRRGNDTWRNPATYGGGHHSNTRTISRSEYHKIRKKNMIKGSKNNLSNWLQTREHRKYNFSGKLNKNLSNIAWLAGMIVATAITYSNIDKLSSYTLWFIQLGGVLMLGCAYGIIKYGTRVIGEGYDILYRQKNWVKYTLLIILMILLWQGYQNKDTVLEPLFEFNDGIDYSAFNPFAMGKLDFGVEGSYGGSGGSNDGDEGRNVTEIEAEIHRLVNEERSKVGVGTLMKKDDLDSFVRSWSKNMLENSFLEHSTLNFPFPNTAAENIAENPIHYNVVGCGSTYSNKAQAECFVSGWIDSPSHYQNMVNPSFSMTGIGVACDYVDCKATQVFAG